MQKCPFCSEEIRDDAKKCRWCGEWLVPRNASDEPSQNIPVDRVRDDTSSLTEDYDSSTGSDSGADGMGPSPATDRGRSPAKRTRRRVFVVTALLLVLGLVAGLVIASGNDADTRTSQIDSLVGRLQGAGLCDHPEPNGPRQVLCDDLVVYTFSNESAAQGFVNDFENPETYQASGLPPIYRLIVGSTWIVDATSPDNSHSVDVDQVAAVTGGRGVVAPDENFAVWDCWTQVMDVTRVELESLPSPLDSGSVNEALTDGVMQLGFTTPEAKAFQFEFASVIAALSINGQPPVWSVIAPTIAQSVADRCTTAYLQSPAVGPSPTPASEPSPPITSAPETSSPPATSADIAAFLKASKIKEFPDSYFEPAYWTAEASTTDGGGGNLIAVVGDVQPHEASTGLQAVFFWHNGEFVGLDDPHPRVIEDVSVAGPNQIAVRYTQFAADDPQCCASLPPVTLVYSWDRSGVVSAEKPPQTRVGYPDDNLTVVPASEPAGSSPTDTVGPSPSPPAITTPVTELNEQTAAEVSQSLLEAWARSDQSEVERLASPDAIQNLRDYVPHGLTGAEPQGCHSADDPALGQGYGCEYFYPSQPARPDGLVLDPFLVETPDGVMVVRVDVVSGGD